VTQRDPGVGASVFVAAITVSTFDSVPLAAVTFRFGFVTLLFVSEVAHISSARILSQWS
jgi:hypothetical protein